MDFGIENGAASLTEILRWRAQHEAGQRAFTFLSGEGVEEASWTYADLDARANAVAAKLIETGPAGSRAVLLCPPGLDFVAAFYGCLYARWVAVPSVLPRSRRPAAALLSICDDAEPAAFLTTTSALAGLRTALGSDGRHPYAGIAVDLLQSLGTAPGPLPAAEDLAFLQYTSGSTGAPKGVMIRNRNILANARALWWASPRDLRACVGWLPHFHDMGLMSVAMYPVFHGIPGVFMAPSTFLQTPLRWLEAISRSESVVSGGPNFAYDLCVRKVPDERVSSLDLSRWKMAFTGAEPIRGATLKRFQDKFGPAGFQPSAFFPCYGMAETTLFATGRTVTSPVVLDVARSALEQKRIEPTGAGPASVAVVGCGSAPPGHDVRIVDPSNLKTLPDGEVGEIWVRGASVSDGYWKGGEKNQSLFRAVTSDDVPEGPYLRTGDLGSWWKDDLFITGRLKDLLIVRGRNLYPADLEETLARAHPALSEGHGAAFAVEAAEGEGIAFVHELNRAARGVDGQEVISAMRAASLDTYGVALHAVALVRVGQVPLTTSGKVQRADCRRRFLAGELEIVAEWRAAAAPSRSSSAPPSPDAASEPEVLARIVGWMASTLGAESSAAIERHSTFACAGLDSIQVVEMLGDLSRWSSRTVPPSLAFDYPTPAALARALAADRPVESARSVTQARVVSSSDARIAVVGIGCRFPGSPNPEAFWTMLQEGRHAVQPVPASRWDAEAVPDSKFETGKRNTRFGGFLDSVDLFDAQFFDLSPQEAAAMDPQQRILLEVAWESLESAGISPDSLRGTEAGVFIGISSCDFYKSLLAIPPRAGTGVANSIAANRISYFLDLRGPSIALDTACSSSLVAVHLAMRSLRTNECSLAIAGGVNVIISPENGIAFSQAGMMAPDGMCKSFDARADGYVRGEGCGLVVLKRLADAIADGDPIQGILLGSAVTQDGRSNGLTAPSGLAQQAVLRKAIADAGLSPADIDFVEAHGSGTPLGDVIEVHALANVLGEQRPRGKKFGLGSVKANIGHAEAASGIAGLIKALLMLRKQKVPPQPTFERLNPRLEPEAERFWIPTRVEESATSLRFAGVSSFGFGGTNAHVVLQRPPPDEHLGSAAHGTTERPQATAHLLCLSAKSEDALRDLAGSYARHFADLDGDDLSDVCFSAHTGRAHFRHRMAVVGRDWSDLRARLVSFASGERTGDWFSAGTPAPSERPPVVFVFPAAEDAPDLERLVNVACNGSVLGPALEECARLESLSFDDLLRKWAEQIGQHRLAWVSIQYALSKVWSSWGIVPDVVLSRGAGRWAAACATRTLTLAHALALVARGDVDDDSALDDRIRPKGEIDDDGRWWAVHSGSIRGSTLEAGLPRVRMTLNDADIHPLASMNRDLAALYAAGVNPDWKSYHGNGRRRRRTLPPYAFQRKRFWPDSSQIRTYGSTGMP